MQFRYRTLEEINEAEFWKNHFTQTYGFTFFEPSFDKVPFVSSLFDEENIIDYFQRVENYLLLTYPIYRRTNNHLEMHKLRSKFSDEEYPKDKQINKLGVNRWGTINDILLINVERLNIKSLELIELSNFHESILRNYGDLEFVDKLAKIRDFDALTYKVLEEIYEKYS